MIESVDYPQPMIDSARWMVRIQADGANDTKQPQSIHESQPEGYSGPTWFRTRWSDPIQWASFADAVEYAVENDGVTHLCFVIQDNQRGDARRFIAFDFDGCIDDDGQLDPVVNSVLQELGTWVEVSKNGKGLHAVGQYYGPAIKTQNKVPVGNCFADIITSGQIVCTGKQYQNYAQWNDCIDLSAFDFVVMKEKAIKDTSGDCWGDEFDGIPSAKEYLIDEMKEWPICCRSKLGSALGSGGDVEFFKAACHLARHGVTGEGARKLLEGVQVDPVEFTHSEITHKIQSAFEHVSGEQEFGLFENGVRSARAEFDAIEPLEIEEAPPTKNPGFEGLEIREHFKTFSLETMPKYIIKNLLFEQGALMIGGQNKTFKTSIGLDLLVSLATLKPFLNEFPIECDSKSIAVFSSETREWMMTQYLGTVLKSKGITVDDIHKSFTINSNVPSFRMDQNGRMARNMKFERYMSEHKPDIVFFDPLYRMFAGVNQADISSMGQALEYVEQVCIDNNSMPIFCHHSRKPNTAAGVEYPVMTLNDLSGAGGGAFTRQWLLLSHTREYVNGSARLHCCVGASGADTTDWVINLETWEGPKDERQRVWQPSAYGLNVDSEVMHRLSLESSSTVPKLAKSLKKTEYEIRKAVDRLDAKGSINLVSNSVQLAAPNLKGEVDF